MRVGIYGAGNGGRLIFDAVRDSGADIDFFIDEYQEAPEICGKPVFRLADFRAQDAAQDVTIYFSLSSEETLAGNPDKTVFSELVDIGFHEVLSWRSLLWVLPTMLGRWRAIQMKAFDHDEYLRTSRDYFARWSRMTNVEEGLRKLRALLRDEISMAVLDRVIAYRNNPDDGPLTNLPDQMNQYFPRSLDVFRGIDSLRFADCGAFDGDTMYTLMLSSPVPVSHVFAFEPDLQRLEGLRLTAEEWCEKRPETKIVTYSSGVWSHNDILSFKVMDGGGSRLVKDGPGTMSIPVLSIDSVLAKTPPNFIKMDVEGAEAAALEGAKEIIRIYHPTLAICVYHKIDDLWELPCLIKDIYPDYEFHLRHHDLCARETVLYCIAPGGPVPL